MKMATHIKKRSMVYVKLLESSWVYVNSAAAILKFLSATMYLVIREEFQTILSPINLFELHNNS